MTCSKSQEDVQQAVNFAVRAHAGQFRQKSGLPYICHPLAVVAQVAEWEIANVVTWKAAICHDVLEDTKLDFEYVVEVIGEEAAGVVEELTFVPDTEDEIWKPSEQKIHYMQSFGDKSLHALVVKVADRFCNTYDWLSTDPDYAPKYWKMARDLLDSLMNRGAEINEFFGSESIFPRMKYTQTNLAQMVNF